MLLSQLVMVCYPFTGMLALLPHNTIQCIMQYHFILMLAQLAHNTIQYTIY